MGLGLAPATMALEITRFSPQGEIAKITQLSAQFDQPAVPLGDPQATAPLKLQCQPEAKGSGRWLSERQWVFDFEQPLPAGTRCTTVATPGFRSPQGQALTGRTAYAFGTGGPVVLRTWPGDGATINEDQHFVVRFAGQVTRSSLLANAWCELDGVGERLPVQWIGGAARAALLKARRIDDEPESDTPSLAVLDCGRRLSASAQVRLVLGAGISTPGGVKSRQPQVQHYDVREPFSLEFSCQRENAQAACLPLRPMTLSFSAPVSRERAMAIRLASQESGANIAAQIDEDDKGQSHVNSVLFRPPFPENARYRIMLPGGFVDDAGRAADNAPSFPLDVATGPMPPLAKFAASPFGVIERLAEPDGQALLPVTVRNVEAGPEHAGPAGGAGERAGLEVGRRHHRVAGSPRSI